MTRSLAHNAGLRSKPTAWMDDAACRGADAEIMFSELPGRHGADAAERAKAICRSGCPVIEACLSYAMTPPYETFGVWGALSAPERLKLRGRRNNGRGAA